MKEQLISFKTAKLAKKKGFDIKCNETLYIDKEGNLPPNNIFETWSSDAILELISLDIPTQSLLQKWLREKHMIRIYVAHGAAGNFIFNIHTFPIPNTIGKWKRFNNIQSYNSYEEALEEGLQGALKQIIKWKNN